MHIHAYISQKSTGKGNFFLCKRKKLICSIKSFLSINSFNLELSVKVIKLIEYVHYEYKSFIVQEKSIENFADFLISFNYSIIQPFFKHSLSLFFLYHIRAVLLKNFTLSLFPLLSYNQLLFFDWNALHQWIKCVWIGMK